jgi:exodeoxyribonuclease V gamma subunit
MQIHHAATAGELAYRLASLWSGTRSDPFAFDLAVVPGAGFQRWLSQQLATANDAAGICAGIEFVSAGQLLHRVGGADDPWRPARLARAVQQVVLGDGRPPELTVLRAHLDASRETWSATGRIARQFAGYARYLPGMLANWEVGRDLGPDDEPLGDHAWQAALYRLLVAHTGTDPLTQRRELLQRLADGGVDGLPRRIAIADPPRLDRVSLELYEALSRHHQVDLLLLTHSPVRHSDGHPLNLTLGRLAAEQAALLPEGTAPRLAAPEFGQHLLGWLKSDLFADAAPVRRVLAASDRSVQVHLSHGPSRQVEVLREVLAGLFAADPTLEPRHVAVLTPDVDVFGPLLGAAFTPQPGGEPHPAHTFRLQLADRTAAQVNPLVDLLLALLRLPDSRVEASALLELCATGPVAARFGFSVDDIDRLSELVRAAGIRWGLNASQRSSFGLGEFSQNTWLAGLQRMLLGVTISDADLVSVGTVLPLDDVDSSDVALIGGVAELLSRLWRWLADISQPASLAGWVQRCRAGLDTLVALAGDAEWQLADLLSGLARLSGDDDDAVPLSRHAAIRAVTDEFTGSPARGAFGNGSLVVAGLESLRDVPHRVVVLLGWDAERYPRNGRRHGDDLVGVRPPVGAGSAALTDRQALLDAVHAAQEHLVVIARARSEATNQPVPVATPLAELFDALDATAATTGGIPAGEAVTVHHPLQPFAAGYFTPDSDLSSFDPLAFRAARAKLAEPLPPRQRYHLDELPPPEFSEGVGLDALIEFFRHPVRALLSQRAGLSLSETQPPSDSIPLEPDALARWQIGNRVLHELQSGHPPDSVDRAERLRGQVPPARLGTQLMERVLGEARQTLAVAPPAGEPTHHDLSLLVAVPGQGEVRVSGRVATIGGVLWQAEYSQLQPRHRLAAWLRLLALAAAGDGGTAHVVGKGAQVRYQAPTADAASALLGRYLAIYTLGLTRPLPAPPRLTEFWASCRSTGHDPMDPFRKKRRDDLWKWESDANWHTFYRYPDVLALERGDVEVPGANAGESTLLGALASAIWEPVFAAEVSP